LLPLVLPLVFFPFAMEAIEDLIFSMVCGIYSFSSSPDYQLCPFSTERLFMAFPDIPLFFLRHRVVLASSSEHAFFFFLFLPSSSTAGSVSSPKTCRFLPSSYIPSKAVKTSLLFSAWAQESGALNDWPIAFLLSLSYFRIPIKSYPQVASSPFFFVSPPLCLALCR